MGTHPPLSDRDYLTLCVWSEARGECPEGQEAVAQVVLNRTAKRYSSDGTIRGTVLRPNQFSGFYFDMVHGQYRRVCYDMEAADSRAHVMLAQAHMVASTWEPCVAAALRITQGRKPPVLPEDAVLYYNPAVVHSPPLWATPEKFIKTIGHHAFYRD